MDYLTEQTQLLNGEIDDITITAKDKNVIIIGAGDTGADCVATALRENCKSIVQFNKYTKLPEAITFTENASWPLAMPVFKWTMRTKSTKLSLVRNHVHMVFKQCVTMLTIRTHTWFVYSNFRRPKWYGHERRT